MPDQDANCPAARSAIIDMYFMEHRAKLLDVAAFLDRIDRAGDDLNGVSDFRVDALRDSIAILLDGKTERTRRILERLSDQDMTLLEAAGLKGAYGASPPSQTKEAR